MISGLVIIASLCINSCEETPLQIIDADKIVLPSSEIIKIYNVDTPHITAACSSEVSHALTGMAVLAEHIENSEVRLTRIGQDKTGATLASISVNGYDLGDAMISKQLAGDIRKARNWCF